jgi:hypothetical protein
LRGSFGSFTRPLYTRSPSRTLSGPDELGEHGVRLVLDNPCSTLPGQFHGRAAVRIDSAEGTGNHQHVHG